VIYVKAKRGLAAGWREDVRRPEVDDPEIELGAASQRADPLFCALARPVFDLQVFEANKVPNISGHQSKVVHARNCRNLSVDVRRRTTRSLESRSLETMPRCRLLVIGQNRKRFQHYVVKVRLELRLSPSRRQTLTPVRQFVPDNGRDCALMPTLRQTLHHVSIALR
jgi:hypothetical protein